MNSVFIASGGFLDCFYLFHGLSSVTTTRGMSNNFILVKSPLSVLYNRKHGKQDTNYLWDYGLHRTPLTMWIIKSRHWPDPEPDGF